jgi:hypothetical protein
MRAQCGRKVSTPAGQVSGQQCRQGQQGASKRARSVGKASASRQAGKVSKASASGQAVA